MQSSLCLTVKRGKEKEGDKNDRRTKMGKGKNDSVGNKTIGRPGGKFDDEQLCFAKGNQERENRKISKMHGTN
ncbi:hypothetical protein T06_1798 [Trichinella sp. T6]|nr:hypothetical protein T06_1798 [Trichinella sp. T6]